MKKRIFALLLCLMPFISYLAVPVSADFQATYYNEEIYAGGILDLMAFVGDENLKDYSFRWQFAGVGSDSWVDLEENANYKGTKTNHLQVYTKADGDYEHWEEIPFRCLVTKDGVTKATPNIHMHILPYDSMLKAMKNKSIGLYEPSLTNVTGLSSEDDLNYTAAAYAGSNIRILCGGSTESSMSLLQNSDVQLKREIRITENGKYIVTGDQTNYIPYTVGNNAVKIEINMRIIMAGADRGIYQTKTIHLTTKKPDITATGKAKSACSLLRYTYNESEKLASISKGTNLEIIGKEGGYYQVYYNGFVGYVGTSLVDADMNDPKIIEHVDLSIAVPQAGNVWSSSVTVKPDSCFAYHFHECRLCGAHCDPEDHRWSPKPQVANAEGHAYQCADCMECSKAQPHNPGPEATETTPQTCKDCGYIIEPAKDHSHTLTPVEEIPPTCTAPGMNAYYTCSGCSDRFFDKNATEKVTSDDDLVIPPQGHQISNGWGSDEHTHWRICAVCTGKMIETDMEHDFQDGRCTTCAYESTVPQQTTAPTVPAPTMAQPQPQQTDKNGMP